MSHAVVLQVKLAETDEGEAERMLNEVVVPNAKGQPGFEKGIWMRSADGTGMGVVVFDSEDSAKAAESALQPPPGGPTLISSSVLEVGAQA